VVAGSPQEEVVAGRKAREAGWDSVARGTRKRRGHTVALTRDGSHIRATLLVRKLKISISAGL
jgi:hypothetical protein